jgi:hypothetical protein
MQSHDNVTDENQVPARKPYHRPKLEAAGDFRKLTLMGSGGSGGSGGKPGPYGH